MADRSFGVREINIVGSAGTPTISSPDNINLNGNKVAISTDLQVGRNVSVVGVVTASELYGGGANITGISTSNITDYGVGLGGGGGSIAGINTTGTSYFSTINLSSRILSDTFYVRDAGDTLNKMFFGAVGTGHVVRLYAGGSEKLTTASNGIFVQGTVGSNGGANITGVVTATSFVGDGSLLTNLPGGGGGSQAGIDTVGTSFFNTLHATGTIDIGTSNAGVAVTHMTIDSADVSGTIRNRIQSGAGNTNAVLDIQTKEFLVTDPYSGKGALIAADSSGTKLFKDDSLKLQTIGTGVTVTGTMYATAFSGDGSQLTGVPISGNTGSFVRVDSQELVVSGLSTFQGNVYLGDNNILNIGDNSSYLRSYISSGDSYLVSSGVRYDRASDFTFTNAAGSENFAVFVGDGTTATGVDLYGSNGVKLTTVGYGVSVTGTTNTQGLNISGVTTTSSNIHINQDNAELRIGGNASGDIRIYHTGTESVYYDNYGITRFAGGKWEWTNIANDRQVVEFDQIYGAKLNYDGTRRFMTTNDGVHVAGIMTATSVSIGGTDAEPNLTISSDGTDTFIKELNSTGELTISTNQLKIENPSFETLARFNENADVKLYYDNAEKFATTGSGINVTGVVTATSFVGDGLSVSGVSTFSNKVAIGSTAIGIGSESTLQNLKIYHDGDSHISHGTWGQDDAGDLIITSHADSSNIIFKAHPVTGLQPTNYIRMVSSDGGVFLYYGGVERFKTRAGGVTISGDIDAEEFTTSTTVGDGSDRGFATKYYITADGSSNYRFAGPGVLNTTNDPTLYFHRGFTYILENSTGSGHPFELRVSAGGAAYSPGGSFLTGSINGTQVLTVPFDAPSSIVYQCTLHSSMLGTINFVS